VEKAMERRKGSLDKAMKEEGKGKKEKRVSRTTSNLFSNARESG
jgi:hypothetical protein